MEKGWSYVKKILKPSPRNRITYGLLIVSIFLDPFIFYAPSIQDEEKLYKINTVMVGLTSFVFVLNLSVFIHRIYIFFGENKKSGWLQHFFNVESNAVVVPTVILYALVFIPKLEIRASIFAVLGIFLVVCLVRVIGIYRLITEEVKDALVKILLNLLLFLYGGHLFGGLWYLFAVWKTMACWKRACSNHSGCRFVDRRFNVSSGDNKFLNDTCFPAEDTKTYELGIFKEALKYHIVETRTGFWKKVIYCFRWGIQNISGFGQNLQVSTYEWENIFVILIAVYAVGTFTFFIGNMENLIKSAIDKKSEKRQKQKEDQAIKLGQQWPPFGKLSENLKIIIIKEYQKYNGQQTGGVELLTNLPEDIKNNIKRELCLEMLKKVERLKSWSETSLLHLCDCVKPVVYVERTRIVHVGDPINEMLFVLQGKLGTFSSEHTGSMNNVPPRDRRKELLKDGDFWGEELVNWVHDESCSSSSLDKLISHTTIQALTKVEAFVLGIDDLKNLYNEKAKILRSWLRKRRIRISERNTQTSTEEQTPPPPGDHQLTGPEFV